MTWPPSKDELKQFVDSGMSNRAIAAMYGVGHPRVAVQLHRLGIRRSWIGTYQRMKLDPAARKADLDVGNRRESLREMLAEYMDTGTWPTMSYDYDSRNHEARRREKAMWLLGKLHGLAGREWFNSDMYGPISRDRSRFLQMLKRLHEQGLLDAERAWEGKNHRWYFRLTEEAIELAREVA